MGKPTSKFEVTITELPTVSGGKMLNVLVECPAGHARRRQIYSRGHTQAPAFDTVLGYDKIQFTSECMKALIETGKA